MYPVYKKISKHDISNYGKEETKNTFKNRYIMYIIVMYILIVNVL